MGTNATCHCYPYEFSEILLSLALEIEPANKKDRFKLDVP